MACAPTSCRAGTRPARPTATHWTASRTRCPPSAPRAAPRAGCAPTPHPMTKRSYLLRSYVHCAICGGRMIGKQRSGITYYRCKTTHADPRTLRRFPDHPNTVSVREDVTHAAVEGFFADHMFGSDRAALLAEHFSEAADRAHREHVKRVGGL